MNQQTNKKHLYWLRFLVQFYYLPNEIKKKIKKIPITLNLMNLYYRLIHKNTQNRQTTASRVRLTYRRLDLKRKRQSETELDARRKNNNSWDKNYKTQKQGLAIIHVIARKTEMENYLKNSFGFPKYIQRRKKTQQVAGLGKRLRVEKHKRKNPQSITEMKLLWNKSRHWYGKLDQ